MREYVWLECTACGDRNYRTQKETRGAERLELKKYCRASGSTRRTRNRGRSSPCDPSGPTGDERGAVRRPLTAWSEGMAGRFATSVAQLVEHRSPKPAVGGSIPSARAPRSLAVGRPDIAWRRPWRRIVRGVSPPSRWLRSSASPSSTGGRNAFRSPRMRETRPWAKSKTKRRPRRRRSPPRGRRSRPKRRSRPVPRQPRPGRPLQADAGMVRPARHGPRPGRRRGPRALAALRDPQLATRRPSGSASRWPSGWCSAG